MKKNKSHLDLDEKHVWIALGSLFVFALGFILYQNELFDADYIQITEGVTSINTIHRPARIALIDINFGESERIFQAQVDGRIYPFVQTLDEIAKVGKFTYKKKAGKIAELAGIGGSNGLWQILQNGQFRTQPIEWLTVQKNDHYILQYERKP